MGIFLKNSREYREYREPNSDQTLFLYNFFPWVGSLFYVSKFKRTQI
jgi:hypothetical protein